MKVGEYMAGRGQPKKFTKEQFKNYVITYFERLYDGQNDKDAVSEPPTFFGFYRYVNEITNCSYHTIRRCYDEYWADIKKEFEELRADLLIRGSSMGRYNATTAIFALKNWCKWTDRQEVTQEANLTVTDNFLEALNNTAVEDWNEDIEDETAENNSVSI
ncbi:hypothetical protein [Ruminococcus sp.]|uniref:hypothetical protein n=1 Tax=Ruminococcus sp. TaxID=41978 RepID=UPI001B782511|nr:hypothetical protein [Ruminococcus sp.]MBP5434062.1 hypothetical protein [Ruminococcus sp.]